MEIRRIIDESYKRTETLLTENMDKLHAVAQALLIVETLDAEQFEMIFNGEITIEEGDALEDVQAKMDEIKSKQGKVALDKLDKEVKENQKTAKVARKNRKETDRARDSNKRK